MGKCVWFFEPFKLWALFLAYCSGFFSGPLPGWGVHRRNDFLFDDMSRTTGDGGAVCFWLWCLFLSTRLRGGQCLPHNDWASTSSRCYGSTAGSSSRSRRGSPSDFVSFSSVLLGLVALSFFLLGGWGSPCRVFPFPRRCGSSFLWVGWVPLPRFPGVFPRVLGGEGGRVSCFCFSCYLLRLASFFSCN